MGRPAKYPWRTMKVGDEFVMDTTLLTSARSAAYARGVDLGKTFQVRKSNSGVIRCKRIR